MFRKEGGEEEMKKWLIILFLLVFLGRMPLTIWNLGTPDQQSQFVEEIGQEYMSENKCLTAEITVISDGTTVFFFAECKGSGDLPICQIPTNY